MDLINLDEYYEDCVIGGPGAFMIPIRERRQVRRRNAHQAHPGNRRPHAASRASFPASADKPRMSCMIGERMWQERWGGYEVRR